MLLSILSFLTAQATPIAVEPNHTVSVGIVVPKVIQEGHGERLTVPAGWQADARRALEAAGHRVVPTHQADVLLQPTVQASGCTVKRGELRCSAWVGWRVRTGGNDPQFQTNTNGAGADLQEASRATWLGAFDELLSDPGFVQALHYGPLSRYDCAFAGQMAAVPTRIAPEQEGSYQSNYGGAWTFGLILGTQEGWFLTGLGLLGGGSAIMGASQAAAAGTDNASLDLMFGVATLFGAAHVVVGASMLGLEVTEGTRVRVHLTGNGVGITGRF